MTKPTFQKQPPRQTSASLTDERGRADVSHQSQDEQTENETNIKFKNDRKVADDARTERRAEADKKMNIARIKLNQPGESGQHVKASAGVMVERQAEDDAIKVERLAVDKALGSERNDKDAAFKNFVDQARE